MSDDLMLIFLTTSSDIVSCKTVFVGSNRVGGGRHRPQPPTPPYVPFGIRRFIKNAQNSDAYEAGS